MKITEFLDARKKETLAMNGIIENDFKSLDNRLFNTVLMPGKWSIAECFVHLNITLRYYIPQCKKVIAEKHRYIGKKSHFTYGFAGMMSVKYMVPKGDRIRMKMKTLKTWKISPGDYQRDHILKEFLCFQKEIIEIIDNAYKMDIQKPKIISAAGPLFKMKFGDTLHFIVAHNRRHILQAQKVLKALSR